MEYGPCRFESLLHPFDIQKGQIQRLLLPAPSLAVARKEGPPPSQGGLMTSAAVLFCRLCCSAAAVHHSSTLKSTPRVLCVEDLLETLVQFEIVAVLVHCADELLSPFHTPLPTLLHGI